LAFTNATFCEHFSGITGSVVDLLMVSVETFGNCWTGVFIWHEWKVGWGFGEGFHFEVRNGKPDAQLVIRSLYLINV